MPSRLRVALAMLSAAALVGESGAEAQDPFEIQVYDDELNDPGRPGLELHSNMVLARPPSGEPGPELPKLGVLHETLEGSYGVSRHVELGAYVQLAVRPEGRLDFAGVKLRLKLRAPFDDKALFGAALNIEVSYVPAPYDAAVFGGEVRPILRWRWRELFVSVNPILDFGLTGRRAGIPDFTPAVAVRLSVLDAVAVGVEYYGDWGGVDRLFVDGSAHYLFQTLNVEAWKKWELHAGVGVGLTSTSDALIVKTIVGHEF